MKLPKFSKKLIAIGAAAGIAMGAAGIAVAFTTGTGTGTGNASVSSSATWTVSSVTFGGPLAPGAAPVTVDFTITNNGPGNLKANKETVQITGDSRTGTGCSPTNFKLVKTDGWDMYNGTAPTENVANTYTIGGTMTSLITGTRATQGVGTVVAAGHHLGTAGRGYLKIFEATTNATQNECATAEVYVTVTVT